MSVFSLWGFHVDLVSLDNFDDYSTLVDDAGDDSYTGTRRNRHQHSANAYAFEFGDVY